MELAVVILNWNAAQETIRCVRNVRSWTRVRPTIWVVDNHSVDGSPEVISREFPDIHVLPNSENLGFGGGNNRGIVQSLATSDAPILLLNNDAFIEEQDVLRLGTTLGASERLGFVGPLLFSPDGEKVLLSAGGRDIAVHLNTHIERVGSDKPVRETAYVPGTVVLIRSQVLSTIGLFDPDYFFSGEMADLCERARRHGYASVIDTRARAYHAQHDPSRFRETLYAYYSLRNRFLFIRKFRRCPSALLYGIWALYGLGMALKAFIQNRPARARAVCLAVLDGLRGRFGGQNARVLSASLGSASGVPLARS
jgi:GT2 family glycosyltransferase